MAGNRGIYFKGWSAVTRHSTPWLPNEVLPALDDDVWELYDGNNDWSQARDLAAEQPDRLAKLQRLWLIEAVKYNVLPIDDRRFERLNATIAGRPQLITGTSQVLFPGMKRLSEGSVIDIKNRSFSVTASIDAATNGPTNGVIIAQGGKFGGWALFFAEGKAKFVYNLLGMQEFVTEATEVLAAGSHQVRAEFAYDGGGLAKGGTVTLYYDGVGVGTGRVDVTQPLIFSADETTDIGNDYGMPVSAALRRRQQVQRPDRRGADRRRRRRPFPPDRPGTGRDGGHLPAVGTRERSPAASTVTSMPQAIPARFEPGRVVADTPYSAGAEGSGRGVQVAPVFSW